MHTEVAGTYLRVADPDWDDPLDATHSRDVGGRWNAAGTFAVLYVNADRETARANVQARFAGLPYGPEDLDPIESPLLVEVEVPDGRGCDLRTDEGLAQVGLPPTYPLDDDGEVNGWSTCQPIGQDVHDGGLDGIACRSAAPGGREELAWFPHPQGPRAQAGRRQTFEEWYWAQ